MRLQSVLVVFAALSLVGCGGSSRASADASVDSGLASGLDLGLTSTPSWPVQEHRPVATACPALVGNGCPPGSSTMQCVTDADCTSGTAGRCNNCICDYSTCQSDSDCSGGEACICYADTNTNFYGGNTCSKVGNCRVDSDCGPNGACSPVFENCIGQPHAVEGYYCHTAADLCNNDSDCTKIGANSYCDYAPEVGHWACAQIDCAG
ncbi:MAG TPA: hypothetical protein VIA18_29440 [Polyangia bacterium]|jgi:hypothetical protein|nr:hypothetical protein [Polyangia bacterium]